MIGRASVEILKVLLAGCTDEVDGAYERKRGGTDTSKGCG